MDSDLLKGFYLDGLLIEPLKGQVTGPHGSRHLTPKAVEVLLCLARSPGELVQRDALLEQAWGAGKGSAEALNHAIGEIRQALDDHADDPRFIQTVPRRGYRLVHAPAFDESAAPARPPAAPRTWWQTLLRHGVVQAAAAYLVAGWVLIQVADTTFSRIGLPPWSEQFVTFAVIGGFPILVLLAWSFEFVGGRIEHDSGQQPGGVFQGLERNYVAIFIAYGLAAIGAGAYQLTVGFELPETLSGEAVLPAEPDLIPVADNSLAVLRLATFDADPRTKAFSDGLSEDILDGLARIPGLFVSARGDSWSLPPNASSGIVRRRLRVANYIEGSVRFLDDKLRVVIQLIDSESGFHLFSRDFEIEVGSVGEMQRELASLVVANLRLAVDSAAIDTPLLSSATEDRDAFTEYMFGREAANRPRTIASVQEAIGHFEQALAIDARYPAAHAGLCGAHVSLYELRKDPESIDAAEAACSTAQAVAPRLPVVLNSIARLHRMTGQPAEAEQAYLEALAIDEQDAVAIRGLAAIRRGQQRYEEAERLMKRAIELQPGNWLAINGLGNLYFRLGRFAAAAAEYRKVVYLDPENHIVLGNLAATSLMAGDFAGARDALLQSLDIEENATFVGNLGIAYYYLGDLEEATSTFRRALELAPNSTSHWISLGDALRASGDMRGSAEAYARARELADAEYAVSGDDVDILTYLAWATLMTGERKRAVELARLAVELDPAYPYSHYYNAIVALHSGDPAMAIDSARLALENGYPVAMLASEPILKELWGDSRFVELMATHSLGEKEQ